MIFLTTYDEQKQTSYMTKTFILMCVSNERNRKSFLSSKRFYGRFTVITNEVESTQKDLF